MVLGLLRNVTSDPMAPAGVDIDYIGRGNIFLW